MTEEERQAFNGLSARVQVLHLVMVELCRRELNSEEIEEFFRPLDPTVSAENPELAETLNRELTRFRQAIMTPIMVD